MQLRTRSASAALAAAALLIHSLVVALPPAVFAAPLFAPDGGTYTESPASPLLANSSPVSAAADPPSIALASNLYRRKAAQNFTQEGYKNEYERDKDKENKRINHYEAKPGNGCYTVCGGKKTHTLYLFEDEDAWDDSDLAAADEAVDVDYAVEGAEKEPAVVPEPAPSVPEKDSRTHQHHPEEVARRAGGGRRSLRKKTAGDATGAGAAADDTTAGKKGSWNPFKKKAPNPDEIKHVTVGGGLLGKFQLANKMRSRAQNKINTHVDAGGCVVVHNKINGQHGL
ncbi:hypothetical protein DFJ73DRAFT_963913 [Zopfochytrium polystomum]|nr:hypothetical protein DFJ73DRAFT_963913 [Zopfochytrium polystomum]